MKVAPEKTAYFLLRLTMGVNTIIHGFVRFPKITGFRNWMLTTFENTILPSEIVYVWSSVLPFLEFIIGTFILIGWFTYKSLTAGALLIILLIFGSCISEHWEWAGIQMIYALFYYFLISKINDNSFAIDTIKNKKT